MKFNVEFTRQAVNFSIKTNNLFRFQNTAKVHCVHRSVTHLLFKDSQQREKNDDPLVSIATTVVEGKLPELCNCFLYIFPRIDLHNVKDERSLFGIFPFSY